MAATPFGGQVRFVVTKEYRTVVAYVTKVGNREVDPGVGRLFRAAMEGLAAWQVTRNMMWGRW